MNSKQKNIDQDLDFENQTIALSKLGNAESKETNEALRKALIKRRANMSPATRLELSLLQLRLNIEEYLEDDTFDKHKTLGYFLKAYIKVLNKKANEFASEIAITPAVLSQYITDARIPPTSILVRLELHSHNTIPAEDWYRLVEKGKVHEIKEDRKIRRDQRRFVIKEAEIA
jgi:hypothetical protein